MNFFFLLCAAVGKIAHFKVRTSPGPFCIPFFRAIEGSDEEISPPPALRSLVPNAKIS